MSPEQNQPGAAPERNAGPAHEQKASAPGFRGASAFSGEELTRLQPYLPGDLVGGSIPYVPGTEDEGVWNAAAQACGTERVHYCYTINEERCWYLATPSSALASNPDSWCPLAAALPGNSEYWDRETVYLYEQEGAAGALRWDKETGRMQVFLGAARTILPRVQSMEANFVTINPEAARPVPWRNRALNQERLSRGMARILMLSGLFVTFVSLLVLMGAYTTANVLTPQLDKAKEVTTEATNKLMLDAAVALQSSADQHLARIVELINTIGSFGGVLTRYEVFPDGKVEWEALIPSAVAPSQLQATALGVEGGRVRIRGTY
jgi:hypothetical protein